MNASAPDLFDRRLLRRRLERAAAGMGGADFLHRRSAEDVEDRLSAVTRRFGLALALGVRGGALGEALARRRAAGQLGEIIEADLAFNMLAPRAGLRVEVDEENLPFAEGSLDLVVTGPILHWSNDLVGVLIQIRRALRPDGLFLGALLGGASLGELRQCLLEADLELSGGAGPRVSPFADAFDGAALLQRAGFALPVCDLDRVTVRYELPLRLLWDLRAMGETNALRERSRKPLTRALLGRAFQLYEERFGLPGGRVPATFELISLTGWAPHESQPQPLRPGSAKMRLADALGARERRLSPDGDDGEGSEPA